MLTRTLLIKGGTLCVLLLTSVTASLAKDECDDECKPRCRWRFGSASLYTNNNYHFDPRDTRVYASQAYNTPVTIPVAPMARTYNYGWGVPSSRLSPIGGYTAWHPDVPYTQRGGRLPGGIYPTVYQPTDSTQLGYYYNHTPGWQRR
jgi:hypothetical protein